MEKLLLDDFTKYSYLSGLKYSPSGKNLAFIKHQINMDENKYQSYIYLVDKKTNTIKRLTSLGEKQALPGRMMIPWYFLGPW